MVGPNFSTLSPSEIGRAAFDDATGTLRTSLQAAIVGVVQEVKIDAADDSVVAFQPNGASLHVFVDNFASLSISVTAGSTVTVANSGFTAFQGTNPWIVGGTVTISNPGSAGSTVTVANSSLGVTFGAVSASISNFPAVQAVTFPVVAVQSVTLPIGLTVFQGTNPWITSVGNFPASQGVTFGVVGVTFPSDENVSGVLAATNAAVAVDTEGHATVYLNIGGTFVATLLFEAQAGDGVWNNVAAINQNNGIFFFVTVPGVNFIVPVGGFDQFRVRAAAYTSGTALIQMNSGAGANVVEVFQPVASALQFSANGLAATASPALTSAAMAPLSMNIRGHLRTKWGGGDSSILIRNDYSASMVSTAAYFQLSAATSMDINRLQIFDSSGQDFVLATGSSGAEVDQIQISPGGWDIPLDLWIPSGSRMSIKSKGSTASSGILLVTGLK